MIIDKFLHLNGLKQAGNRVPFARKKTCFTHFFLLALLLTACKNTIDGMQTPTSDAALTADRARELGLVDQVVPAEGLEAAAMDMAHNYARKSMSYLCGVKQLTRHDPEQLKKALEKEAGLIRHNGQLLF